MEKRPNSKVRKRVVKCSYRKPTLFKVTEHGLTLTDEPPVSNLRPDDFELANLMSAGVNTDSKVNFEKSVTIDKLDEIDATIAKVVSSEQFNKESES